MRVIIGHSDDTTDIGYITGLADRGYLIGMDRIACGQLPEYGAQRVPDHRMVVGDDENRRARSWCLGGAHFPQVSVSVSGCMGPTGRAVKVSTANRHCTSGRLPTRTRSPSPSSTISGGPYLSMTSTMPRAKRSWQPLKKRIRSSAWRLWRGSRDVNSIPRMKLPRPRARPRTEVRPIMLAGPAYVEWTDPQVLLQRHKAVLGPGRQSTGIFLNCFMFLTT